MPAKKRAVLKGSLVLAILGLLAGIYLTRVHYDVYVNPQNHLCNVSETVNCDTVALSKYAILWGVPVSMWTVLGYGGFIFFQILGLRLPTNPKVKRPPIWPSGLYFLLATFTLVATIPLVVISKVEIGALCLGCLVMYIVNPLLFAGAVWLLRENPGAVSRDLTGLSKNRPILRFAIVVTAAAAALSWGYPKYWDRPLEGNCEGVPTGRDGDDCWVGWPGASLEIVEYSDYRCPYCKKAHSQLRDMVKQNPGKIRLIHKHFPLDMACNPMMQQQLHEGACMMARMAYCAANQGQFWKMNDLLFNADPHSSVDPKASARELGIDESKFMICLDSEEARGHVRGDVEDGLKLKITGTPTFFIGDKSYVGEIPKIVIDEHLK